MRDQHQYSGRYHVTILLLLWTVIHVLLLHHYGVRSLFDGLGYIRCADYLVLNGYLEDPHETFYAIPIALMAFFRWMFPGQLLPYLFFQSVLSFFATLALYRAGTRVFNSTRAGLISGIIFLIWWDNIQWNTTTLTESLACSIICFTIYRLTSFKGSIKDYCWISILLILNLFTRPTGIIIIVGTVAFLIHFYWHDIRKDLIVTAVGIPVLVLLTYWSADHMFSRWDFTDQYVRGNIVTYMDTIEGNELYSESLRIDTVGLTMARDKPPVWKIVYFIVDNPVHFVKAACLKVYYLVTGIRPYYSALHNAYILCWMVLVYIFYYIGWCNATKGSVRFFTVVVVILNCCLIGISTVDWDNRFYIPMEPGIVLLAGGGAAHIVGLLKSLLLPKAPRKID